MIQRLAKWYKSLNETERTSVRQKLRDLRLLTVIALAFWGGDYLRRSQTETSPYHVNHVQASRRGEGLWCSDREIPLPNLANPGDRVIISNAVLHQYYDSQGVLQKEWYNAEVTKGLEDTLQLSPVLLDSYGAPKGEFIFRFGDPTRLERETGFGTARFFKRTIYDLREPFEGGNSLNLSLNYIYESHTSTLGGPGEPIVIGNESERYGLGCDTYPTSPYDVLAYSVFTRNVHSEAL